MLYWNSSAMVPAPWKRKRKKMTDNKTITITANVDGVSAPALRAIRTAVEIVWVALPALGNADFNQLNNEGADLSLKFEPPEDNAEKRQNYQAWLLGKAFQELANGARASLEQAYIYCKAMKLKGTKGTLSELQEMLMTNEHRASRMNFPDLLDAIEGEIGGSLNFRPELLSLQKTRNCLEHRAGFVGLIDCAPGEKELKLDLPHLKMAVQIDGREVDMKPGLRVEKGGEIIIRLAKRTRTFALGQRITFQGDEFAEIAHALQFFVSELVERLIKLG